MQRHRNGRVLAFIAVTLISVILIVWVANPVGLLPNTGLPFGYYAHHNIVRREVSGLPGVTIEREWLHEDVTLESSSIEINYCDESFELRFPWQVMPYGVDPRLLVEGLLEKLDRQLENGPPYPPLKFTGNPHN